MRSFVPQDFKTEVNRQAIYMYFYSSTISTTDTLALLLTDVLVFLQEKDQRFIFAAVVSLNLKSALKSEAPCQALCPVLSIL